MEDRQPRLVAYVAAAPAVDAARRTAILPIAEMVAADATAAGTAAVLVATCHRVELYMSAPSDDGDRLTLAGLQAISGAAAVRRIVDMAVGLESAVLAEDQILHQLRIAVGTARRRGRLDPDLGRVMDAALRAGRLARSWRPVGSSAPGRSLADAAIARATARLGPLAGRRVLVVGAGVMGEAAVAAARGAGARVALASPSPDHALEVAARNGADAWPLDPGARLSEVDLLVVALSGLWRLPGPTLETLVTRPLVVDLSMPPALPSDIGEALGERLLGIDDLAARDTTTRPEVERYRARLRDLADRTVAGLMDEARVRSTRGPAALASRIEAQRRRELEAYLRRRPELDEAARAVLDDATREVAARLFRVPLERLAHDPDGERRRAAEELFGA